MIEFGQTDAYATMLQGYYPHAEASDQNGELMANVFAYMFWDVQWGSSHRVRLLQEFGDVSALSSKHASQTSVPATVDADDEGLLNWCELNGLNASTLLAISETVGTVIEVLFLSRFSSISSALLRTVPWLHPNWRKLASNTDSEVTPDGLWLLYGRTGMEGLAKLVSPVEVQLGARLNTSAAEFVPSAGAPAPDARPVCTHFLHGSCRYEKLHTCMDLCMPAHRFGSECRLRHDREGARAARGICKFYERGMCIRGAQCTFSHPRQAPGAPEFRMPTQARPNHSAVMLRKRAIDLFQQEHEKMLLVGEGSFAFTESLIALELHPLASTTQDASAKALSIAASSRVRRWIQSAKAPGDVKLFFEVDATRLHMGVAQSSMAMAWLRTLCHMRACTRVRAHMHAHTRTGVRLKHRRLRMITCFRSRLLNLQLTYSYDGRCRRFNVSPGTFRSQEKMRTMRCTGNCC